MGGSAASLGHATVIGITQGFIRISRENHETGLQSTDVDFGDWSDSKFTLESTLYEVLQKAKHPSYDHYIEERVFKISTKKNETFIYTSNTIRGVKLGFLVESTVRKREDFTCAHRCAIQSSHERCKQA